ncbi:hypothetical protein BJ170DRAFT_427197 [Xylariales sp. AK1849]|nr:hypothetical protein BJ170DRAFT_427197 [Xylariales sp. AK1849]
MVTPGWARELRLTPSSRTCVCRMQDAKERWTSRSTRGCGFPNPKRAESSLYSRVALRVTHLAIFLEDYQYQHVGIQYSGKRSGQDLSRWLCLRTPACILSCHPSLQEWATSAPRRPDDAKAINYSHEAEVTFFFPRVEGDPSLSLIVEWIPLAWSGRLDPGKERRVQVQILQNTSIKYYRCLIKSRNGELSNLFRYNVAR